MEATLEAWGRLYEITEKIGKRKPWELFWDLDLIGIQEGDPEDTVFFSILGRGGSCYGISMYTGYEGLNDFMMLNMQESLNISVEYAMFSQNCLTCYWGDRAELSAKQRGIIKDLGRRYRGKNQWLYFMSYSEGYFPYNFNGEEVERMTKYLLLLDQALEDWACNNRTADFENGHMFLYAYNEKEKLWEGRDEALPFTCFSFGNLRIEDEELLEELENAEKNDMILEADIPYFGAEIREGAGQRPQNPRICLIADARSGMIMRADMIDPEEDAGVYLAETIAGFITAFGAPKEIRVTNVIVASFLEDICSAAGIRLRRVKRLPEMDDFWKAMRGRM